MAAQSGIAIALRGGCCGKSAAAGVSAETSAVEAMHCAAGSCAARAAD
jgi:hypothetical protein